MSMTDPIADLLARLRNGAHARKEYIDCPWSVIKERVARVMVAEGFLQTRGALADSRAQVCAARVDKADHHHFPFDEVGVEAQLLSVLVETVNVRDAVLDGRLGRGRLLRPRHRRAGK